jgi:hypothetical protein
VTRPLESATVPERFRTAVEVLRAALADPGRAGLTLHEVPAPRRLAPHAVAVAAEVERDGEEVASGRFVVLHDPDGQEGWRGDTRVVAFVQSEVDAEMAADAALGEVGWSWLTESLEDRAAGYTAAGGTVTRTVSARFGQLSEPEENSEVEVRASWTPLGDELGLDRHLGAWCDLLCATAGLPPPGVAALARRRL